MKPLLHAALTMAAILWANPSLAQDGTIDPYDDDDSLADQAPSEWDRRARFFGGVRGGVAIPTGGLGPAPSVGFELGVSVPSGVGFGLHILGMNNPPDVPQLGIQKARWGVGAMADLRMYFQSVAPLTLYGTLSGGFVAGPGATGGTNVVLPMVNPGFGARVKVTDSMYLAFEFGAAGFFIPFINMSMGWEPRRTKPRARAAAAAPVPAPTPVPATTQPAP